MSNGTRKGGRKRLHVRSFNDGFDVPIGLAAEMIGMSVPTVKGWLESGRCPHSPLPVSGVKRTGPGVNGTWWMRAVDVAQLKEIVEQRYQSRVDVDATEDTVLELAVVSDRNNGQVVVDTASVTDAVPTR